MNDNIKTINLFWIIFMGRVEAGAGMEATLQTLALKPAMTDAGQRIKGVYVDPNTKKRKPRKKQ